MRITTLVFSCCIALASVVAAWRYLAAERARPEPNHGMAAAVGLLTVIFVAMGLLAIMVQCPHWFTAFFWALASLLGGGVAGLLAALPVTVDSNAGIGKAVGKLNTIVGGGVAFQWQAIYEEAKRLSQSVGETTGEFSRDQAAAGGAILLYFALLGLISGLLLTRLFLLKYLEAD